jgi:hypothetical protein
MKYEISREIFKQRLEDKLNFVFIDLASATDAEKIKYENSINIPYSSNFSSQFGTQYPNKNQNVILYSLVKGDKNPASAANDLASSGYNFVYFYEGTPADIVLDKDLN